MTLTADEHELAVQEPEDNRYELESVDESESGDDSYPIDKYDLVSSPNDFNTSTIVDFIDRGVINIPGFQRNYVWDIKRALPFDRIHHCRASDTADIPVRTGTEQIAGNRWATASDVHLLLRERPVSQKG